MLDGKKLGKNIWSALKSVDAKTDPEKHWINVARLICDHISKNAEIPVGIQVSTSAGSGYTTGKGKVL